MRFGVTSHEYGFVLESLLVTLGCFWYCCWWYVVVVFWNVLIHIGYWWYVVRRLENIGRMKFISFGKLTLQACMSLDTQLCVFRIKCLLVLDQCYRNADLEIDPLLCGMEHTTMCSTLIIYTHMPRIFVVWIIWYTLIC